MKDLALEKFRYPIGRFKWKPKMSEKSFEFHKKKLQITPMYWRIKSKTLAAMILKNRIAQEVGKFLN